MNESGGNRGKNFFAGPDLGGPLLQIQWNHGGKLRPGRAAEKKKQDRKTRQSAENPEINPSAK
jgi:hypothetical protein